MIRTYRFLYVLNKRERVQHFEAISQSAAVADFEATTGLSVEKNRVSIERLDDAGLVR